MLQGFSSSLFYWNSNKHEFCVKTGIYASRLFQASLHCALDQFIFCGTCLKLVELFVKKVEISHDAIPTLRAFAGCVSSWLKVSLNSLCFDDHPKIIFICMLMDIVILFHLSILKLEVEGYIIRRGNEVNEIKY